MAASNEALSNYVNFHFEYTLEAKTLYLEGMHYTGIGVFAKMVDTQGNEKTTYIQDITTNPETALELVQLLNAYNVSPMCLKMFVDEFLSNS